MAMNGVRLGVQAYRLMSVVAKQSLISRGQKTIEASQFNRGFSDDSKVLRGYSGSIPQKDVNRVMEKLVATNEFVQTILSEGIEIEKKSLGQAVSYFQAMLRLPGINTNKEIIARLDELIIKSATSKIRENGVLDENRMKKISQIFQSNLIRNGLS